MYIGSSIQLRIRLLKYFNANYLERNTNMTICRALFKHGYSNFSLEILEYCVPAECLEREDYYIKILKPEYNISQFPKSPQLGLKHSKEARIKMKEKSLGKVKTEQHKLNLALADPNSISASVADLIKDKTTTYPTMGMAARDLGISISSISNYFTRKQKKPYKKRYIFRLEK